ncbi:sulfite exporter TauE/SafE family protein [uncultured Tateyamaria sp.]|uniref:sulfite exporter TauE/SafE family protein n=1 Tax=uncultured Tateyamaria sp. TaxID=455651 RepID=UPI002614273E|nr:sulfite exporter TauE/SafE family protein [uncultured Tateyamaria sp.]
MHKLTFPTNVSVLDLQALFEPKFYFYLRFGFFVLSCALLLALLISSDQLKPLLAESHFWKLAYFLVGICAALVANSTGVGGGVVFLPVFISLGVSPAEVLATSIAIQCFGMTSGSLSWLQYRSVKRMEEEQGWSQFWPILWMSTLCAFIGVACVQAFSPRPPFDIKLLFSIFSIVVGCLIALTTIKRRQLNTGSVGVMPYQHAIYIVASGLVGGAITAWISVGVGEILAICLILLGYRLNMAIALAVCVGAATVFFALPFHLSVPGLVNVQLLVCAAPGALIGGAVARKITVAIGAYRMKLLMALWIISSATVFLFVSLA